jgi:hypothetical protein
MTTGAAALTTTASPRLARTMPAWLLPVLAGAIVIAAGVIIVDSYVVGIAHDDGMYVILGKALATGQGYRWLHVPGAPPATHFPPGYPAVLALLWLIFPNFPANVVAFKIANALFMGFAAIGVACFARARFGMSEMGAALVALATTLGIPTLTLSALVMSEPLFLALLLPALVYAERVVSAESPRTRDLVALALLVGVATLVRTHGVTLLGAVVIILGSRRRFRDAALFAGVTIAMLIPWQLWVSTHTGYVPATMRGNYESYGAWFVSGLRTEGAALVARTVARTTSDLAAMFEVLVAPSMPSAVRIAGLVILLVLGGIGARVLWRRAPVTSLFLALYAAIVIIWPFSPARFVWGVWPLIVLVPILGVRDALTWRPVRARARAARLTTLTAGALLVCGYGTYTVRGYRHQWWSSIPRNISRNVRPLLTWVATRTPPHAVLATEAEAAVYLYTGRSTVPVGTFTVDEYFAPRTPVENAAVIGSVVAHYRPKAVVVSSGAMRDAVRELALGHPPTLAVVDTFPGGGLVLIPISR